MYSMVDRHWIGLLTRRHIMTAFRSVGVYDYVNDPPNMTGENPPPAGMIAMAEVQCPVAQPDRAAIIANGTNQRRAEIMAAFQKLYVSVPRQCGQPGPICGACSSPLIHLLLYLF